MGCLSFLKIHMTDLELVALARYPEKKFKGILFNVFDSIEPNRLNTCIEKAKIFPDARQILMDLRQEKCFICPLCKQYADLCEQNRCDKNHFWCLSCLKKTLLANGGKKIDRLYEKPDLTMQCIFSGCKAKLPPKYILDTKIPEILDLKENINNRQVIKKLTLTKARDRKKSSVNVPVVEKEITKPVTWDIVQEQNDGEKNLKPKNAVSLF
jgi:hypothetical protein